MESFAVKRRRSDPHPTRLITHQTLSDTNALAQRQRFGVLDSWRGIAALLVVVYHIYETRSHISNLSFIRHGLWFVDFFFVLSGFVISHAYFGRLANAGAVRSFIIQRIGRIYPLHIAMLAVFVATELAKLAVGKFGLTFSEPPFTGHNTPFGIFTNLTLIHSFGFHPNGGSWNQPSWSIGVEFYTYLIFAAVVLLAKGSKTLTLGLIAVSAVIIFNNSPSYLGDALILGIFRCVFGFMLGHFVWRLKRVVSENALARAWIGHCALALESTAIGVVIVAVSAIGFEPVSVVLPPVFCVAVFIFAFEAGPVSALLKTQPFFRLGELSYSIYMTHAWVIWVLTIAFGKLVPKVFHVTAQPGPALSFFGSNPWLGDVAILVAGLSVIALSSLTYRFIEMPGRTVFRTLAYRLEQAPAASSVSPFGDVVADENPPRP